MLVAWRSESEGYFLWNFGNLLHKWGEIFSETSLAKYSTEISCNSIKTTKFKTKTTLHGKRICGFELHAKIFKTFFNFIYRLGVKNGLGILSWSNLFSELEKLWPECKKSEISGFLFTKVYWTALQNLKSFGKIGNWTCQLSYLCLIELLCLLLTSYHTRIWSQDPQICSPSLHQWAISADRISSLVFLFNVL